MNNQTLKLALADDIKIIKKLDPEIIPANVYYGTLFKVILGGFWKIFLIQFLTLVYSFAFNTNTETPATFFDVTTAAAIVAFLLSSVALLVLLNPINFYILFRFHLKDKLKIGSLLTRKFKFIAHMFLGIFSLFCVLFGSYGSDTQILFMLVLAFFGSLGITFFLVKIELNRLGVSAIFALSNEFFNKGKRNQE